MSPAQPPVPPPVLDEADADAIAELFNIGMGQPAAALSEMIGEEVRLSVPALAVSTRQCIAAGVEPRRVCAVRETFTGPFAGEAMLIFPEAGGLALVRRLIPGEGDTAGAEEQDALAEIGNIILNGCLASFSNLIDGEVSGSVPDYRAGPPGQLIGGAGEPVLFVRIDVALASGDARGQVLFLLDIASLDAFREAIRRAVEGIGG